MSEVEIALYRTEELEPLKDSIWDLLVLADREFLPRLSARHSTTDMDLDHASAWTGPVDYFKDVMSENFLVASLEGRVAGMMSFTPHYQNEALGKYNPSTHVTTTIVKSSHRRQGIGIALNRAVETLPDDLASPFITRRTWSTNIANVELLTGLGFEEIVRYPNHRGPGIDTIYFGRATLG